MKMKKIICALLAFAMLLFSMPAFADVDWGSADAAELMDAIEGYVWNGLDAGLRVTVYDASTEKKVFNTIDISGRRSISTNDRYYFAETSDGDYIPKTTWLDNDYVGGTYNSLDANSKTRFQLSEITIISENNTENLEAIRELIGSENFLKELCSHIEGLNLNDFKQGKYKIAFEPVAYLKLAGQKWAATATELGILNQFFKWSGSATTWGPLVQFMGNFTHSQVPLSAFLEKDELGVEMFEDKPGDYNTIRFTSGRIGKRYKDNCIIGRMGIGVLSGSGGYEEINSTSSADYHTDTDVYTSFSLENDSGTNLTSGTNDFEYTITSGSSTISSGTVSFNCPDGEKTLGYFSWKTPRSAQSVTVTIKSNRANVYILDDNGERCTTLVVSASISKLAEKTPPDPKVTDKKPNWFTSYTSSSVLNSVSQYAPLDGNQELSWYEWTYENGTPKKIERKVSLSARMQITPSRRCYTAIKNNATGKYTMKSGYGIQVSVTPRITGDTAYCTGAQTANVLFPEFNYNKRTASAYNRLLEKSGSSFVFKTNEYSTYNDRVHFTPIWYPDNTKYTAYGEVLDVWCPAGQLSVRLTDYMTIKGNVYDDWHVAPGKP